MFGESYKFHVPRPQFRNNSSLFINWGGGDIQSHGWLRQYATSWKVMSLIPGSWIFQLAFYSQLHYSLRADSASNRNEYQESSGSKDQSVHWLIISLPSLS
jgi:hypothetical protein